MKILLVLSLFSLPLFAVEETKWDFPLGPIDGTFRIHTGEDFVRVTSLDSGGPGDLAGLQENDFLLGANGVPFSAIGAQFDGLVRELGDAIAFSESNGGALSLDILRPGVGPTTILVTLPQVAADSPAVPLNSVKWQSRYDNACLELNTRLVDRSGNIGYPSGWAGMALLAHPNWDQTTGAMPFRNGINACRDYYADLLDRATYAPVEQYLYDNDKSEGGTISLNPNFKGEYVTYLENWWLGLGLMFLSEYYQKIQDAGEPEAADLLVDLQTYAEKVGNRIQWWRQPPNHSSGHSPLRPGMTGHGGVSGDYMHYSFGGGINVVGIHLSGGLAMAKQVGVDMTAAPIDGRYFGYDPLYFNNDELDGFPSTDLPAGIIPRDSEGNQIPFIPDGFDDRQPTLDEKLGFIWDFYKNSQSSSTGHVAYAVGTGSLYDSGARTPGALFTAAHMLGDGESHDAASETRIDLLKGYLENQHDIHLNAHAMNSSAVLFTQLILPELSTRQRRFFSENWRFWWTLMRQSDGTQHYISGRDIGDSSGYRQDLANIYLALPVGLAEGRLEVVPGYETSEQRLLDFSKVAAMKWSDIEQRSISIASNSLSLDLEVTDGAGSPTMGDTFSWSSPSNQVSFSPNNTLDTTIHFTSFGSYEVTVAVASSDTSITTRETFTVQVFPPADPNYEPGLANYQVYTGISGTAVADLTSAAKYPHSPDYSTQLSSLQGTYSSNNYGATLTTHLVAPETGDYTFYLASDDQSSLLFNSSGVDPAEATEIASVSGWTGSGEWNKFRSQQSVVIQLVAGERYYLQALHKESGGADVLEVAWTTPSNSSITLISSPYLSLPIEAAENSSLTLLSTDQTIELGDTLTLSAQATGPQPALFQWSLNGQDWGSPSSTPLLEISNASAYLAGLWSVTYTNPDGVITSDPITVPINGLGELSTGGLWRDVYTGISGSSVSQLTDSASYPRQVDSSGVLTETATGTYGDNYGQRWSGWIIPAETGRYRFYASGDDHTDLYLSPTEYESHKELIHSRTGYTSEKSWSSKAPSRWVELVAGQRYFVEFFHKEGGGGDHAAFTWQKEGDPTPTNGEGGIPFGQLQYAYGGTFADASTAPPFAAPDQFTHLTGQTVTLAPLTNDADANLASVTITAVTQPASGSVSISPDGRTLSLNTPAIATEVTFDYTITNAIGLTATETITVVVRDPADGLVGYWRFETLDGGVALDSSGNGHHGSTVSTPINTPNSLSGRGLQLDSSSDYIDLPVATLDSVSDQITISFWIKSASNVRTQSTLLRSESAAGDRILNIHLPWSNRVYWDAAGGTSFDRVDAAITSDQHQGSWHQWTFTKNASTGAMTIYLDGEVHASGADKMLSFTATPSTLHFGRSYWGDSFYGELDELRIYNRELTAAEITVLYESEETAVSLAATTTSLVENPASSTTLTFTRSGETVAPLTIPLLIAGSARNGSDYQTLSASVTIPAGRSAQDVLLSALDDDLPEHLETIELSLTEGEGYRLGSSAAVSISIVSEDDPEIEALSLTDQLGGISIHLDEPHELTAGQLATWWSTTLEVDGWTKSTSPMTLNLETGAMEVTIPEIADKDRAFFKVKIDQ